VIIRRERNRRLTHPSQDTVAAGGWNFAAALIV
jgi:hypothetical protein